ADAELREFVTLNAAGAPELDMIFLGMGEDGHVASLFPPIRPDPDGSMFLPVVAAKPPPNRITISYSVIAAPRNVWVLASGEGKAAALADSLKVGGQTPLAEVIRQRHTTKILTDIAL